MTIFTSDHLTEQYLLSETDWQGVTKGSGGGGMSHMRGLLRHGTMHAELEAEVASEATARSTERKRYSFLSNEKRDELILHNQRLVNSIARRFSWAFGYTGMDIRDLHQHGNVGLAIAADKYDASRGVRFSTYATYWITEYCQRCVAQSTPGLRLPQHQLVLKLALPSIRLELEAELGRKATSEELAKHVMSDHKTLFEALQSPELTGAQVAHLESLRCDLSLDESVGESDGDDEAAPTLSGILADDGEHNDTEAPAIRNAMAEAIRNADTATKASALYHYAEEGDGDGDVGIQRALCERLLQSIENEEHRRCVALYYGIEDGTERTRKEVAEIMGFTKNGAQLVNNRIKAGLKALQKATGSDIVGFQAK